VQLHAHTSLWSEPAEWADRLSHVIDPQDAFAPHVWAAMANAAAHAGRLTDGAAHAGRLTDGAAHAGRLTDGLQLAERALASDDLRAAAVALEAIADIATYQGDLARCGEAARQLSNVGRASTTSTPRSSGTWTRRSRSSPPTITTPRCRSSTGWLVNGSLLGSGLDPVCRGRSVGRG
jgi:hypothetical protein